MADRAVTTDEQNLVVRKAQDILQTALGSPIANGDPTFAEYAARDGQSSTVIGLHRTNAKVMQVKRIRLILVLLQQVEE